MSKGLEALEIVKAAMLSSGNCLLNSLWDYTDAIEKELKALESIKEKKVDVNYLIICIEQKIKPLQFYNEYMKENNGMNLTQEEYDLLKEVLL